MARVDNRKVVLPNRVPTKANAALPGQEVDRGNSIARDTFNVLNTSIELLRATNNVPQAVRELMSAEGTFSAAAFSLIEVAQSGYTAAAYETGTHELSVDGTRMVESIIASIDTLYDYTKGYSDKLTMQTTIAMALQESITTGGVGAELVLTKERLPDRINIFPYDSIEYISRGDGTKYPEQATQAGEPISLDLPTIFISELHRHADKAYARSMMEPAINASYAFQGFFEEMRRSVRRSGHSRLIIKLNAENVLKAADQETQEDPDKAREWMQSIQSEVENIVNGLEPEDALVTYDSAEVDMIKAEGEKADFVPLINAISGQLATSLKTSPSIIGLRINGSQSLSNTESLIYLKTAKAAQKTVEDVMSRALTLAARLYGMDVYVKFRFNPINLRPEDELEAFKTMRQQRIFNLLSEGFITDEEAAVMLGTGPRPEGAPLLSGTGFMRGQDTVDANDASPNDDPQGRALQPDTPTNGGGESQDN